MTSTVTFEFWRLAQMALKNVTKLTRLQLEKDPDRLAIQGTVNRCVRTRTPAVVSESNAVREHCKETILTPVALRCMFRDDCFLSSKKFVLQETQVSQVRSNTEEWKHHQGMGMGTPPATCFHSHTEGIWGCGQCSLYVLQKIEMPTKQLFSTEAKHSTS